MKLRKRVVTVVAMVTALALAVPSLAATDPYESARLRMVETQIESRGVEQPEVLRAMRLVPRHEFVPPAWRGQAYEDHPLSIGRGQTISQPYIVAFMCELLDLDGSEKVLEIGTGSGYHAAVLSRLAAQVFTIEIIAPLAEKASEVLERLGYDNVHVRIGDGYGGWPEEGPFDAIILTAAPARIPPPLFDQLAVGGRLVAPVGKGVQNLELYTKTADGLQRQTVLPVVFVPMTGEAEKPGS